MRLRASAPTHVLALVAVALVAPRPADAEDLDPDHAPMPGRSITLGLMGHGSRVAGHPVGGFGPLVELAVGRDRWQYTVEAALASASRDDMAGGADAPVGGKLVRGAVGLRWLARQFAPHSSGGVELFLSSELGVQRFYFDDRGRLTRPEVALGGGMQIRGYRRPRIALRLDVRVLFTPAARGSALASCRSACMDETGAATGFLTGIGFAW